MSLLEVVHTIDINIFALVILSILLAVSSSKNEKGMIQHQLFMYLIFLNMLLTCLEILGWIFDARAGGSGAMSWRLNLLANYSLYCFEPVPAAVWFLYAHYQIFHDPTRLKRVARILLPILFLNVVLSTASIRTGWFFSVNSSNFYNRGPWFILHVLFPYGMLAAACLIVFTNRKLLEKRNYSALLFFVVPQIIGTSLQVLIYGLSLNWAAMMISVLIVYLHIQDRGMNTDYLTGAYNRRHFEQIISNRIRRISNDESFAVILADMDNFKKINDQFGHKAGDEALQIAVSLVRRSLRKDDLIARFGGDEFYFLLELSTDHALNGTIKRIYQEFERYNDSSSLPYLLELSMGGAIYDPKSGQSAEQFLRDVDQMMYKEKTRRQQLLRGEPLKSLNRDQAN